MFRLHQGPFIDIIKEIRSKPGDTEEIVIGKHKISEITEGDLYPFPNLQYLYIPFNNLTRLDHLERNFRLKFIDARYNQITDFDLSHQTFLEELYLSGNKIQNLEVVMKKLSHIRNLRVLDLRGNPLTLEKNYKQLAVSTFPDLQNLDGHEITQYDHIKYPNSKIPSSSINKNMSISKLTLNTTRRKNTTVLQCLKERPLSSADQIVQKRVDHILKEREKKKEMELLEQTAVARKRKEDFEAAAKIKTAPMPEELDFLGKAERLAAEKKPVVKPTKRPHTRIYFKKPSPQGKRIKSIGERLFEEIDI